MTALEKPFSLLPEEPPVSQMAPAIADAREAAIGRSLPRVVRDFYSRAGAEELLQSYSDDRPVPLDRLGAPVADWYGEPKDFVAERRVWFMTANQGVATDLRSRGCEGTLRGALRTVQARCYLSKRGQVEILRGHPP